MSNSVQNFILHSKNIFNIDKYYALSIYSYFIMFSGIILISYSESPSPNVKFALASTLMLSSFFALLAAINCRKFQIPLKYHAFHSFGLLIYASFILYYDFSLYNTLNISTFYLMTYGICDMIFCFQILMMKDKINMNKLIVRMFLGLFVAVCAGFIKSTFHLDESVGFVLVGVLLIITGINLLLIKTILKSFILIDEIIIQTR